MNPTFELPWFLLLIPLGLVAVFKLVRQKSSIGYSSTAILKGIRVGALFLFFERLFLSVFVVASVLILARPIQLVKSTVPIYQQARDITVVLDISGSMASDDRLKKATGVIGEFVAARPQDRIALVIFDTQAFLEWPLSLDHETLVYRLNHATTGGGTQIATGIIAGLKQQQRFGKNPGAIIVVSDGGSEVTAEEKTTIKTTLGQTKLYWIWIYTQEDLRAQQFGDYAASIGGKVYRGGIGELAKIFAEINRLETSPVLYQQRVNAVYHYGLLPLVALVSLFLAGLVDIFREV